MNYITDDKVNTEFQNYISRNVLIGQFIKVDGFKIGGEEASSQNCLVSIDNPLNPIIPNTPRNQFINVAWCADLFAENIKLRNENNDFITRLQNTIDSQNTYGDKYKEVVKAIKGETPR